jgi:hypothetical protein
VQNCVITSDFTSKLFLELCAFLDRRLLQAADHSIVGKGGQNSAIESIEPIIS